MKEKYFAVHVIRNTQSQEEVMKTIIVSADSPREAVDKTNQYSLYDQINWPQNHFYDDDPPLVLLHADKAKIKIKEMMV